MSRTDQVCLSTRASHPALRCCGRTLIKLMRRSDGVPSGIETVVITALAEESEAVVRALGNCVVRRWRGIDLQVGRVQGRDVLVLPLGAMGNASSAQAAQQAITEWSPANIFIVGITGGARDSDHDLRLGDVIIPDQIIGYELARLEHEGPAVRFENYRPSHQLLQIAKSVLADDWAPNILTPRPDGQPGRTTAQSHIGPIFSGEKVVADTEMMRRLRAAWPAALGVEMEGLGVALASYRTGPSFLLVKGISDYADPTKDNSWRAYAAEAAARFAVAVLTRRHDRANEDDAKVMAAGRLQRRIAAAMRRRPVTAIVGVCLVLALTALGIPLLISARTLVPLGPALLDPIATLPVPPSATRPDAVDITLDSTAVYTGVIDGQEIRLAKFVLGNEMPSWQQDVTGAATPVHIDTVSYENQLIVFSTGWPSEEVVTSAIAAYDSGTGRELWRHEGFLLDEQPTSRYVPVAPLDGPGNGTSYADRLLDLATGTIEAPRGGRILSLDSRPAGHGISSFLLVNGDSRISFIQGDTREPSYSSNLPVKIADWDLRAAFVVDETLVVQRTTNIGHITEGYSLPKPVRQWHYMDRVDESGSLGATALRCGKYVCVAKCGELGDGLAVLEPRTGRRLYSTDSEGMLRTDTSDAPLPSDRVLLDLSNARGTEAVLLDPKSSTTVALRRNEFLRPLDERRIISIESHSPPDSEDGLRSSTPPPPISLAASVIDVRTGGAHAIGSINILADPSGCATTPEYIACLVAPNAVQLWRIPPDTSRNSPEPALEPIPSMDAQSSRHDSLPEGRDIGPRLPTLEDFAAAQPAEIVWPKAVRRLPERLPNGSDYNVIGEPQPGRFVVQETTGFERLGSVRLFTPSTEEFKTLLNVTAANPKNSPFALGEAQMADANHVSVQVNYPNPTALWTISLKDGSISKIPIKQRTTIERVGLWLHGALIWVPDQSSGFMTGTKKVPDSDGFQFTGDGAWAINWSGTGTSRKLHRWNLETGERSTFKVPHEGWSPLSCAGNWCTGLLQGEQGQEEIATINTQGETRRVPSPVPGSGNRSQGLLLGRFVVIHLSGSASGAPLIWDVQSGRVASLPKHDTSLADGGEGAEFLLLRSDGNGKTLLNLSTL